MISISSTQGRVPPPPAINILFDRDAVLPTNPEDQITIATLTKSGFNSTDIEQIKKEIPDLKLKILLLNQNSTAEEITADIQELRKHFNLPVVVKLEGKVIIASEKITPEAIQARCTNLLNLQFLDSLDLQTANQSSEQLASNLEQAERVLPEFLQKWIDERVLLDDLGPKHEVTQIAIDALRLYCHFDSTPELIAYWNRARDHKLTESDPTLRTDFLMLASKVVMIKLENTSAH